MPNSCNCYLCSVDRFRNISRLHKMLHLSLLIFFITALTLMITTQLTPIVSAVAQISSEVFSSEGLLTDRVTLHTINSGSFTGNRVVLEDDDLFDPNVLPRHYFSFKGIPYASPPLKRWTPPTPPEVRRAPRLATLFKPMCSQWDEVGRKVVGNPDCLYLNIFTPYVPSTEKKPISMENATSWTIESKNLLPVLVYVHGGEFIGGSSNDYGPELFMKEHVVLVTFNYRLGLLGFLSNGEESMPGNYGLLDQLEALRWIKQNIYRFGGNPLRTCVFGNVEHLLLANGAKGLFQSAIISPVSTSSIFAPVLQKHAEKGPKDLLHLVAKEIGCPFKNDDQILQCLQVAETSSLMRVQHRLLKFFNYPHYQGLSPIIDGPWAKFPLISDQPKTLLENGHYLSSIPLMIGLSGYEGFNPFFEFYMKLGPYRSEILKDKDYIMERLESTLKTLLNFDHSEFHLIFQSVWDFYFGSIDTNWPTQEEGLNRVLWKLFRIFGDLTVNSGQRKLTQLLSSHSKAPVFNYIFNSSSISHFSTYLEQRVQFWEGNNTSNFTRSQTSLHSTDIPPWKEPYYLFKLASPGFKFKAPTQELNNRDEKMLSSFLIKLYVSFATYGSPKHALSSNKYIEVSSKWMTASDLSLNYFVLGQKCYPMKGEFRKAESIIWLNILPKITQLSERIEELEGFPLLFWIFVGLTTTLVLISGVLVIFICSTCCRRKEGNNYLRDNNYY